MDRWRPHNVMTRAGTAVGLWRWGGWVTGGGGYLFREHLPFGLLRYNLCDTILVGWRAASAS